MLRRRVVVAVGIRGAFMVPQQAGGGVPSSLGYYYYSHTIDSSYQHRYYSSNRQHSNFSNSHQGSPNERKAVNIGRGDSSKVDKEQECSRLSIMSLAVSKMSDGEFLTHIGSSSASNPARSLYRHFRPYIGQCGGEDGSSNTTIATDSQHLLLLHTITARCRVLLGLLPADVVGVDAPSSSVQGGGPLLTTSTTVTNLPTRRPLIPKHLLFGTRKPKLVPQQQHPQPQQPEVTATTAAIQPPPTTYPPPPHTPLAPSRQSGLVLDMCRLGIPARIQMERDPSSRDYAQEVVVMGNLWDRIMTGNVDIGNKNTSPSTTAAKKELLVPIITSLNSQWVQSISTTSSSSKHNPPSPHSASSLPHPMARHVLHCVNELVALVDLHLEHYQITMEQMQEEEDGRGGGGGGGSSSHPPVSRRRRRSFFRRGSPPASNDKCRRPSPPPLSVRDVIDSLVFLSRCYEATTQFSHSRNNNTKTSNNSANFALLSTSEVDMDYLLSESHRGVIQCITALSLQLTGSSSNSSRMLHTQEEDLLSGGGGGLEADDVVTLVSLVKTLQSTTTTTSPPASTTTTTSSTSSTTASLPPNSGIRSGSSSDGSSTTNSYLDILQRTVSSTLGRFNRGSRGAQYLDANQLDRMLIDVLLSRTLEEVWGCGGRTSSDMFDFSLSPTQRVSILSTLSDIAPTHTLVKTLTARMAQHAVVHMPVSSRHHQGEWVAGDKHQNVRAATMFVLGVDKWSSREEMDLYIVQLFKTIGAGREVSRQSMDFHAGGALATLLLNQCPIPSPPTTAAIAANSSTHHVSSSSTAIAIRALLGEERAYRSGVAAVDVMTSTTQLQLSRWADLLVIQPLHAILMAVPDDPTHELKIRSWWGGIRAHLLHLVVPPSSASNQTHDDIHHLSLLLPLLNTAVLTACARTKKELVDVCVVLCSMILSDVATSMSTVPVDDHNPKKAVRMNTVIEVGTLAVLLLNISTTHEIFNVLSIALSLVAKIVAVGTPPDGMKDSSSHPSPRRMGGDLVVVRGHNREHLRRMVHAYNHHLPLHTTHSSTVAVTSPTPPVIASDVSQHPPSLSIPEPTQGISPSTSSVRIPARSPYDDDSAVLSPPQSGSITARLIDPRVIRKLQAMCT